MGVYTLTFASVVMGDEIDRIQAGCVKTEQGVDAQNSITIFYKDGRMAQLCSGIMSLSDRKGIIYGSKGYIIVENINNFESIQVYNVERKMVAEYPCPPQISGYEYEVMACVEAVRNGWSECPQMPHEQTLEIMRQMDEMCIRDRYSGDGPAGACQFNGRAQADRKLSWQEGRNW